MSRAESPTPEAPTAAPTLPPAALLMGALACAAPTLLAWNVSPSATFLNQALAFGLWGWFVMFAAHAGATWVEAARAAREVLFALALCGLATLASWWWGPLPSSLALSLLGAMAAAALVALHGASLGNVPPARHEPTQLATQAFTIFCFGWLAAGVLGSAIAAVQVFAPDVADGHWIAASTIPGRAVGNLRQPNHLSSVLLWAFVALIALHELRRWRVLASACVAITLVVAVVLTASRTGLLSVLLLALWGALDRQRSRAARLMLLAAPLVYALAWWALSLWGAMSSHRFGGAERLAETDISGSRFGIWLNTWALVKQHAWAGVGMGEFNIAWTLSAFPGRPVAFFDHAHNLPLHLAAELGLPLATLVLALLLIGLWRVARGAWVHERGEASTVLRAAGVMVLMIGLHSLLEYPLWYAYFLLPAVWVWALALGVASRPLSLLRQRQPPSPALFVGGVLLVVATALALLDYRRVVVIFAAPEGAPPLTQRITDGQRSVLFAHHAAYAAATTGLTSADDPLAPFRSAGHYLLDTRLMMAWAEALHRAGRVDEARHLAARLREFRNPASAEFFEVCQAAATLRPWPCEAPLKAYSWRDFTR